MSSNQIIADFFKNEFPLNRDGLEEFLSFFDTAVYQKNSMLLMEGEEEKKLRFLNNGFVREYYATEERETNINFYTSPQFLTDFVAFNNGEPSKKYQQSLTTVEIKSVPKEVFLKHMKKYDCGKEVVEKTFKKLLTIKEAFEYNRITKSPEVLYMDLITNKPHWLQQIPQYHIASFLGVKPETLSRIRKRIS